MNRFESRWWHRPGRQASCGIANQKYKSRPMPNPTGFKLIFRKILGAHYSCQICIHRTQRLRYKGTRYSSASRDHAGTISVTDLLDPYLTFPGSDVLLATVYGGQ